MKYCLIIDDDWRNYECFYVESQYYELLQHCVLFTPGKRHNDSKNHRVRWYNFEYYTILNKK